MKNCDAEDLNGTAEDLYRFCCSSVKDYDDESMIEHIKIDSEACALILDSDNLNILLQYGYINEELKNLTIELSGKLINLTRAREWVWFDTGVTLADLMNFIRTDKEWNELFELGDKIKALKNEFDKNRKV